jgi:dolichyl-phosphate-mannose--protein O-mannosyl transferase
MMILLTVLAFAVRFYKINSPDQVVCVLLFLVSLSSLTQAGQL